MRRNKMIALGLICMAMVCGMTCCTGSTRQQEQELVEEEVKIPVIFTVDPTTGKKNEQDLVEAFNKEYEGRYEVDVEWIMETEEEYRQNLKRQNITDELPAIITDLRLLPSFYDLMVKQGRLENLTPYIEADSQWKDSIEPVVLENCTEEDGNIYLAPLSTAAFASSGVFWNEKLFLKAGITEFPSTWEEFWNCCEQLKAKGITPLALHTEGTAWATMLFATARIADTREGEAFMKENYPVSYDNASGRLLVETIQQLFSYTTADALHNDFDVSYTNFVSERAAMIPNGYWMIDQIPVEMEDRVRFSSFPGNVLIASPETMGWAILSSYPQDVKEAAAEFLKFRTLRNLEEKEQLLDGTMNGMNRIIEDYATAFSADPKFIPNYQMKWNSVLQEDVLGDRLPELVDGEITVDDFLKSMDESVTISQQE